jgi:hypothetical protein
MKNLRVVLSGMVAGDPGQGGATWAVLQYVLGLRRLGHEVLLVEPVREGSTAAAAQYFDDLCRDFELDGSAALLVAGTRRTVGVPYEELRRRAASADVLINVSGMLRDEELAQPPPIRVYLDLDPAFNQLWHTVEGIDVGFAGHSHYATVGQSIGRDGCRVPTCGLDWVRTLPPVVLERWPVADGIARNDALTTVANWRAYGSIEVDGVHYGQKVHALRALYPLPRLSGEAFVLGLAIHRDEQSDLAALHEHGWRLVDPRVAAGTPELYRRFVQGSRAEFGLAKEGYAVSRCGWFSDRSACYLASGRPVVAHETGLGGAVPAGEGLLTFGSLEEAVERVGELAADYDRHAHAARRLAEEYLDSDRVLTDLLQAVGAA